MLANTSQFDAASRNIHQTFLSGAATWRQTRQTTVCAGHSGTGRIENQENCFSNTRPRMCDVRLCKQKLQGKIECRYREDEVGLVTVCVFGALKREVLLQLRQQNHVPRKWASKSLLNTSEVHLSCKALFKFLQKLWICVCHAYSGDKRGATGHLDVPPKVTYRLSDGLIILKPSAGYCSTARVMVRHEWMWRRASPGITTDL